jgi:hypothetical protein
VSHDDPVRRLEQRLQALAASLAARDDALGLLGLGSVGLETARADAWSDLDFFVLVRPASKARYLACLDWLAAAHPLAWTFANTRDGCRALMTDGLLCEFAVFEPQELADIPYAPGRWVWRREAEVPEAWARPRVPLPGPRDPGWLVGEALSNLLVGLLRWRRGERLAAMRMVQVHALDRVLELIDLRGPMPQTPQASRDPFGPDRRFECRHPEHTPALRECAGGIDATPRAARALLAQLEGLGAVPAPVAARINELAGP